MIRELKEDLLNYLADKYKDTEWKEKTGKGNFNKDNIKPLPNFSLGNFRQLDKNFLLVQCKNINGNRADGTTGLGNIDYGTTITLNIYIEKDTTPSDCALVSDMYIERLYELLQLWMYEMTIVTPINPSISINKYYSSNNNNFNSIDKLIIDCELTFSYKTNNISKERLYND